jgi:hypothetical protein
MEAVAGIEHRSELRMHLVRGAELAVQIVGDRAAERIAVVGRKAEGGDAIAAGGGRIGEPRRLGPLAGAVDAFDRKEDAHGS